MAGLLLSLVLALVAALFGVAAGARRRFAVLFVCGAACQIAVYNAVLIAAAEVTLL